MNKDNADKLADFYFKNTDMPTELGIASLRGKVMLENIYRLRCARGCARVGLPVSLLKEGKTS